MYKVFISFIVLIIVSAGYGQVGPNWVPLPTLPNNAWVVRKITELPNGTLIIAGTSRYDGTYRPYPAIWVSDDDGYTWECPLRLSTGYPYTDTLAFLDIAYDPADNLVFSITGRRYYDETKTVWFSTDYGHTWSYVNHPAWILGNGDPHSCALHGRKLYILYNDDNGIPVLMLLDFSDYSNPETWSWYFVMDYPHDANPSKLFIKGDQLYVFNKVQGADSLRIHIHDLSDLESNMIPAGSLSKVKLGNKFFKQQNINRNNGSSTKVSSTPIEKK